MIGPTDLMIKSGIKMSVELWWNDTERGKPEIL
jgi:hypothetical protein